MLTSKLKKNVNVELHVSEKEDPTKQHVLTIFTDVLSKTFNFGDKDTDEIKDILLECENIDLVINKKKIVLSMTNHS